MLFCYVFGLALSSCVTTASIIERQTTAGASGTPDYFDTVSNGPYPGPTATGQAPFLAQINPVPANGLPSGTRSFVPNTPLETAEVVASNSEDINIFEYMGNLSPYFPNPVGFGVEEYSLPSTCNITQVHILSRHGSRYPTKGSSLSDFAAAIQNATDFKATGSLEFLNTWSYELGTEVLVPKGRQELFDSGILHYYDYGRLYNTSTNIIARTTSEYRMLQSGLYFLNGFFGLDWTNNATLEVILEEGDYNNTLSGSENCPNTSENPELLVPGEVAAATWIENYLANATSRFQNLITGFNWTVAATYSAQTLCPYETVAFGYSPFCGLFTAEEWQGFEYSIDMEFQSQNGFSSPYGRAIGIGWVNELISRLTYTQPNSSVITSENTTLDDSAQTFPLNQTLYFDFTHDSNIMSIITALGLTQFAQFLPATGPPENQQLITSHLTPFGARMVLEKIECSTPVSADRNNASSETNATTYMHMLLNQRTVPLGLSYEACGNRSDGWCEFDSFLKSLDNANELADWEFACYGNYSAVPYGNVTNGAPVR